MPKTVTYPEFLARSAKLQKETYDYSTVEWVDTKTPITIICLKHGPFTQLPSSHMQGVGCMHCGRERTSLFHAGDNAWFLEKAQEVRGSHYGLQKAEYERSSKPVEIVCPVGNHGSFWMTPNKFLSGRDCPKCSKLRLVEVKRSAAAKQFIEDNKDNTENVGYSLVKYVNAKTKVELICKHGHPNFFQSPDSHQHGSGCPACAMSGYNSSAPGILYVLKHCNVTKVGITNSKLATRVRQINRSSGKDFKVATFISFENGQVPTDVETELLRKYRKTHKSPTEIYDGYSECFYDVDYNTLLLDIVNLCSDFLSAQYQKDK